MGCISPSHSVSAIPKYDDQTQNVIAKNIRMHQVSALIELSENDIAHIDASVPATPPATPTYKIRPLNKSMNSKNGKNIIHEIPRKLSTSISSIINPFKFHSKNRHSSDSATSISFEKTPKFSCRTRYKSSDSESEIKEKDPSTTKPSKSKASKYKCTKFATYKGSNSDTSTMDIKDDDSSSFHDFASITKLTNMLSDHDPDNLNSSNNDTMIAHENDMNASANITVSQLSSAISTNYKNIKNPFYHSDDGSGEDADGDHTFASDDTCDEESCLSDDITSDDTSCYHDESYHRHSRTSSKQIMEIKPNTVGDKIKIVKVRGRVHNPYAFRGKIPTIHSIRPTKNNPFRCVPKSKRTSSYNSYNSIAAHITSSIMDRDEFESDGTELETYVCTDGGDSNTDEPPPLPVEWFQLQSNSIRNRHSQYHAYMAHGNCYYFDQFDESEEQKCHQRPVQSQRPCPPPHVFNHYSSYINTGQDEVCLDIHEEDECLSDGSSHSNSTHV